MPTNYFADTNDVNDNGTGNRVWDSAKLNQASIITPGASPWSYTASSHPETLYVRGGTVSAITIGGWTITQALSPTAATSIPLWPGETMIVTYSAVPTVAKVVH